MSTDHNGSSLSSYCVLFRARNDKDRMREGGSDEKDQGEFKTSWLLMGCNIRW
jgi:hypothetical protein